MHNQLHCAAQGNNDLGWQIHWRSIKIHRIFPVSASEKNAEKYIPTSYASSIWRPSKKITDWTTASGGGLDLKAGEVTLATGTIGVVLSATE